MKALAFNWDRCFHLVLCSQLILFHFTNIFGTKAELFMHRIFLMISMAKPFGQNAPKHGAWHKICSLNHAVKFEQKCW
jgi:hypothetical protein